MYTFKLLLIALLLSVVYSLDVEKQSNVVILTTENFDSHVQQGDWLLEFYAPWCGHCKALVPVYEELATTVKGKFNVGKMDCTSNQETCSARFGVRGYPTLKFYKDGKLYDYSGSRTVDAFVSYMEGGYTSAASKELPPKIADAPAAAAAAAPATAQTEPVDGKSDSGVVILTDSNFHKLTADGAWLVKFYAPWCGHCKRLAPIFDQAAPQVKDSAKLGKVDCTVEKAVCSQYDIKGYPTLYYFRDGELREYEGGRSVEAIKQFVEGDWKQTEPAGLPAPPGIGQKTFNSMVVALEQALQMNLWVIIGGCIAIGVLLGLLVVFLVPGGAAEKRD